MRTAKNTIILTILIIISVSADVIDTISFVGNTKTKNGYLQKIIAPFVKSEYDSGSENLIYKTLDATNLFSEIMVVSSKKSQSDSVSIFVIVKENGNFSFSNAGLGLNTMEYGEPIGVWLRFNLDVNYDNFLGLGHSLNFTGCVLRERFLGTNWHILIGARPYFFDVGAIVGRKPSFVFAWEISPYFNTNVRFGRNIGEKQTLSFEISPQFRKYNDMFKNNDEWQVFQSNVFWEIYEKLYYQFSRCDKNYPPLSATFFSTALNTNKIMAYAEDGEKKDFWNIDTDFKQNIPVSKKIRHSLYIRSRISVTPFGEHNKYDGFLLGGQEFLRGWDYEVLGSKDSCVFDNSVLGTLEYQFHILTFPPIKLGNLLSWYDKSLQKFSPTLTGAVFFDAGYLYKDILSPLQSVHATAASAGISLRLLQPLMRLGGAVELAWQVSGSEKYLNKNRKVPILHIGIVSQF